MQTTHRYQHTVCNRYDLGCFSVCEGCIDTQLIAFTSGEYQIHYQQIGIHDSGVISCYCSAGGNIIFPAVYFNEDANVFIDIFTPDGSPYDGMHKNGTLINQHLFKLRTIRVKRYN